MNPILIPIFAILNALRGGGHIDRILCIVGMSSGVFLLDILHHHTSQYSLMVFSMMFWGLWLGLVFGWGKYLNIFSGNMQYADEREVVLIDWITTQICGAPTNPRQFITWCFVAMTFRGMLFYPLFIMLSFYNVSSLIYGLGCSLMGCVYYMARIAPVGYQVRCAEFIYGGLLGLLISFSV